MRNLHAMECFVETARLASLSAAARKLQLTPAAISRSVRKLEDELGVRLLQRTTRRLELTPEGTQFLARAQEVLAALDDAVAHTRSFASEPSGRLRLSVAPALARKWILPLVPPLRLAFPGVEIALQLENRPVDLIAEGIDIAVRGGPLNDASLIARPICALPLVLVATPTYLERRGTPRRVQDLAAHACIAVETSSAPAAWMFRGEDGALSAYRPRAAIIVSDPDAGLELALMHQGIVCTALAHAEDGLASGRLRRVLEDAFDPGERQVFFYYAHRDVPLRVRAPLEFLIARLQGLHSSPSS